MLSVKCPPLTGPNSHDASLVNFSPLAAGCRLDTVDPRRDGSRKNDLPHWKRTFAIPLPRCHVSRRTQTGHREGWLLHFLCPTNFQFCLYCPEFFYIFVLGGNEKLVLDKWWIFSVSKVIHNISYKISLDKRYFTEVLPPTSREDYWNDHSNWKQTFCFYLFLSTSIAIAFCLVGRRVAPHRKEKSFILK